MALYVYMAVVAVSYCLHLCVVYDSYYGYLCPFISLFILVLSRRSDGTFVFVRVGT